MEQENEQLKLLKDIQTRLDRFEAQERKRRKTSIIIWASILAALAIVCAVIVPQIKAYVSDLDVTVQQIEQISDTVSQYDYDAIGHAIDKVGEISDEDFENAKKAVKVLANLDYEKLGEIIEKINKIIELMSR